MPTRAPPKPTPSSITSPTRARGNTVGESIGGRSCATIGLHAAWIAATPSTRKRPAHGPRSASPPRCITTRAACSAARLLPRLPHPRLGVLVVRLDQSLPHQRLQPGAPLV